MCCLLLNYIIGQLGSQTLIILTGKRIQQKSCNTKNIRTPLLRRNHTQKYGKELMKTLLGPL